MVDLLFKKNYSVIDFGTSKISLAVGRSGDLYAEISAIGYCEYAGFRDKEWIAPLDLEESIHLAKKDAEKKADKKIVNIYVAIPGEFTRTFFSHLSARPINIDGRITKDDIMKMIEDGKYDLPWPDDYELMHTSPVLYLLDGQSWRKSPEGQYAKDLEGFVSYTAADKVFMENITQMLDNIGMGVKGYMASPQAIGDLVYTYSEKKTVVVVDAGYYSTDILIYENGGLIIHDNISVGGYHIASDLMVKLNKDRDTAELIKKNCSIGMENIGVNKIIFDNDNNRVLIPTEDTQQVVERRIDEIVDVMIEIIDKTGMTLDNRTAIFLTGGGIAAIKGVKEFVSRRLGIIVKIFKPARPILATCMQTSVCAALEYAIKNKGIVNDKLYNKENRKYGSKYS